jgi:hypothetical protein
VSLGPVNSPPFNPFWRHLAEDPGSSSQQKQNEDLSQNKTPEVKERARGNCKVSVYGPITSSLFRTNVGFQALP